MPASPGSVSSSAGRPRLLIVGLNWLGDAVMSMPAVRVLRERHPEAVLTLLVRPSVSTLWTLFPGVDEIAIQGPGWRGTLHDGWQLRQGTPDIAWVFPKSFRAALLARLSGAPRRIGLAGHWRDALLTQVVHLPSGDARHQMWEYLDLVGAGGMAVSRPPFITPPEADREAVRQEWALRGGANTGCPLVGVFPGAARGPSKRWPAERFGEVARRLTVAQGCRVIVFGSESDRSVCASVAAAAGPDALNLAGQTTLPRLAAWLSLCRMVVANDSGGMHLAAAVGVPTVAIFGLTDPARTGPLGSGHRIISPEGVTGSREVSADSPEARAALLSIGTERVYEAALEMLMGRRSGSGCHGTR